MGVVKIRKKLNQSIDTKYLEQLSNLISKNSDAFAHAYSFKTRGSKKHRFEYYNLICTCILRIRETSSYLSKFIFRRENDFGQAFDFYEFINCTGIIFGCVKSILMIFDLNLESLIGNEKIFVKSNKTKESDCNFFKFIRSAAVAHPENTTRYPKIAKRNNEIYPYATWTNPYLFGLLEDERGEMPDITLLSWAASKYTKYKKYFLFLQEFYYFINRTVNCINFTLPLAKERIKSYKENHRCKRLKKQSAFDSYHDYIVYLRKRLLKLNTNRFEFPDGGLLLTDHIISSPNIGNDFKVYLKKRVKYLTDLMINKFESISFNTIFDNLNLYKVIEGKVENSWYLFQKFDCIEREVIYEIENNSFQNFLADDKKFYKSIETSPNLYYYTKRLFDCELILDTFLSKTNYLEYSYTDIYEMCLEIIFENTIKRK